MADEEPQTIDESTPESDVPAAPEQLVVAGAAEAEMTNAGLIAPRLLEQEMEESYLDYAMSVIVSRALPDVRDGLKPVHRRVLYAMHELGLRSNGKHRKSATVVGDVLGKYHPHGDSAVYDTMVRLAQPFAQRYRLVDGQGNFGSIDGDSAAAMRYTEAKMTSVTEEMLADIEKDTVDFAPNFDGSRQEPVVLPARVPNLLLNGGLGIAVGMATSIPPHNLTEVCTAVIRLIENPEITLDQLMESIKGPDFPTGGLIFNIDDIKNAYATGKGRIVMRGVAEIVERDRGFQIVISALPYQVNKADLVTKIANLVKDKKLEGISDLRDESDREEGVRVVIDLKSSAFPKKILNQLYSMTALETAFHVNMLALVDGLQPRVLTLKQVLEEFLKHRSIVIRRRTQFELTRAEERAHILEGLKIALDHIDEVIETIKKSANREAAAKNLVTKFKLTEIQANAILEMRLSALAALEQQRVEDELKEKMALIAELKAILASEEKIRAIVRTELEEVIERHGDERKTQIVPQAIGGFRAEDLIPNEQVIVTLTSGGYIKRVPVATYRSQHRGGHGMIGMGTKEEDVVDHMLSTWTHNDILLFTNLGRLFVTKVYDLPAGSRQAKGQAIPNVIQIAPDEKVTTVIALDPKTPAEYFFMGTERGVVKKTAIKAYDNVRKTGIIAIKLRPGDTLGWVATTTGKDRVMMATRNGQAILFAESDVRPMGRSASGVTGMRLRAGDQVMAMTVIRESDTETEEGKRGRKPDGPMLLTILENGFGKRSSIDEFRGQRRGGLGVRAAKVTKKTGSLIGAHVTMDDHGDLVMISEGGVVIRIPLRSVKKLGRDTQGVTLMRLKEGDKVSSVAVVGKSDGEDEDGVPLPLPPTDGEPPVANLDDNSGSESADAKPAKSSTKVTKAQPTPEPEPEPESEPDELDEDTATEAEAPVDEETPAKSDEPNYWGSKSADKHK